MPPPPAYARFLRFLAKTTDYERMARVRYRASTYSLDRMRRLVEAAGRPDRAYPVLHVAGTKGKGSTAHLAERILQAHGLRTGLYTSPHLEDLRERIRIDGRPVSPAALGRAFRAVRGAPVRAGRGARPDPPTFFEWMTLLAFEVFRRARVDAAVIEVGLGGRLDATNVVAPRGCAITRIDYDHTDKLGTTLAAIAGEKAGIVKPGIPVVTTERRPAALRVIRQACRRAGAPLRRLGREIRLSRVRALPGVPFRVRFDLRTAAGTLRGLVVSAAGAHQAENAAAAVALVEALERDGRLRVRGAAVREALRRANLPGRLEIVARRPLVILDGGHNAAAAAAVASALTAHRVPRPLRILFGTSGDKPAAAMLRRLKPLGAGLHLTRAESPRARPPGDLARIARRLGWTPATVTDGVAAGLRAALAGLPRRGTLLITGSFYVAGEARRDLRLQISDCRLKRIRSI